MEVYLETARLILRRFTPDDADSLVELDGDPAVLRYLDEAPPSRDEVVNEIVPAFLAYYVRGDRYGFWAAIERATGDFLGWFHFRPLPGDPDDEPELGYRLRRAAWGRGYATEGSRALIDKGFRELGVRRVHASTAGENRASWRVMEKCGMTLVRHFHYTPPGVAPAPGAPETDVEYAITRAEWASGVARGDGTGGAETRRTQEG